MIRLQKPSMVEIMRRHRVTCLQVGYSESAGALQARVSGRRRGLLTAAPERRAPH